MRDSDIDTLNALRRSELRYRSLVQATSAITWSCPPNGLHVEPQPLWMAFTGQSADEMMGSGWTRAIHPDDAGPAAERWARAVASGEPFLSEHRVRRRDGAWRWMRAHAVPVRGPDEQVIEWFGVLVDITEKRQAKEALRASEARFRVLHESMRDAFVQVDMQGRIVECNALYCQMLGYTANELRQLTFIDLTPPQWHEAEAAIVRDQILPRGYSEVYEKEYRRKDGQVIPVELRTVLARDDAGQPESMWAMVRDVSQRRQLQDAQERARRAAEAASEAKTTFLANISHELRTPLNAVLGLNELIRLGGVTPKQAELLEKQRAAGQHLLQVIDAILDLAKIESGKQELAARRFRVEDVVHVVTDMALVSARAKGLHVQAVVETGQPTFLGDDTRLQQALLNYVNNAVKFSESGTIAIRVHPLETSERDVLLQFEVRDEGIGIDAEVQQRLFTPFEQADASSTRRFGGTGLGLSITRRIAELMGGAAGVRSTPGRGSTFWFTARLAKAPPEAPAVAPAESALRALQQRHAGRRVLLAEDDPVSAEIAQHILRTAGLVVTVAKTGREAVNLAASHGFDMILMDLTMPGMDGLEAARQIRRVPGARPLPILALTANAFAEDRARCVEAGMVDLVSKPVDSSTLHAAVLTWLDRAHGLDQAAERPASTAGSDRPPSKAG